MKVRIVKSDNEWLDDVRTEFGKILPPKGYSDRPQNDIRDFGGDEERKHELSKSIHAKIKDTVKIADPDGNGDWIITPMREQLYVFFDNGDTELLENLSVEDLEYIDSFKSLGLRKSSAIKSSRSEGFFEYCFDDVNGMCQEFNTLAEAKRAAKQHSKENPDYEVYLYGMSSFRYLNGKEV